MSVKTWNEAVGEEKQKVYIFGDDNLGIMSCWSTFDGAKKELCRMMHITEEEFDEQITMEEVYKYTLCQDAPLEDVVPVWICVQELDKTCFTDEDPFEI